MRCSAQASLLAADGRVSKPLQNLRRSIRVPPSFPGWGDIVVVDEPRSTSQVAAVKEESHHAKLGELTSTAICGNDITGSCFYVIGGLAAAAGVWAPIGAVLACITLWLFRWVYTETVTALPFNGGIYNVLLNTVKSKRAAALLATLTILSYVATAVVSALSAATYMQGLINPQNNQVLTPGNYTVEIAIGIIVFFAILKLIGISESANVAACMFVGHIFTMSFLILFVALSVCLPASLSPLGWTAPIPFNQVAQNLKTNFRFTGGDAELATKITMGFSKAMLGVSGFETSANFVEEQRDGVFPKTLRNMWVLVSVFNICLIVECLFAVELQGLVKDQDRALAYLAKKAGGRWLEIWVSIDAVIVVAAAVLTSYVGVGGLAARMSGDRCLPRLFGKSDRIVTIVFMCLCISLVVILKGDGSMLGACYTWAFLTVMMLFALSLFVLQSQRPKLPRDMKNNASVPVLAAMLVLVALSASIADNPQVLPIFVMYVGTLIVLLGSFLYRLRILKALKKVLKGRKCTVRLAAVVTRYIERVQLQSSVVYFAKGADLSGLNRAIQYIRWNEDTTHVRIVHVYNKEEDAPLELVHHCAILDVMYPTTKIDLVFVQGSFGGPKIAELSENWDVPTNLMFVTCPTSAEAGKRLQDLRGVRIIMANSEEGYFLPRLDGEQQVEGNGSFQADLDCEHGKASQVKEWISSLVRNGTARRGSGSLQECVPQAAHSAEPSRSFQFNFF